MYLAGKKFSSNSSLEKTLLSISGINVKLSERIYTALGYPPQTKLTLLTSSDIALLQGIILTIEEKQRTIQPQFKIRRYLRKKKGLPVRGQRTRSNARTAKKKKG